MKNLQLSSLMRDYEFVKRSIENPENKEEHLAPLKQLITNFRKKWNEYRWHSYLYSLNDLWSQLDEKLFEEKLNRKYGN
jgi:hypothetical protein